jgi:hypothetical protein
MEKRVVAALKPQAQTLSALVGSEFRASGAGRRRRVGLADAGAFLWVHRMLIGPAGWHVAQDRFHAHGEPQDEVVVSTGWTWVPSAAMLPAATEGLLVASEDWVVLDSTGRMLANLVRDLDGARNLTGGAVRKHLDGVSVDALALERQAQLLQLYLDERSRFLELTVRMVCTQARDEWGIKEEMSRLHERASATSSLASGVREWQAHLAAEARERLLLMLAVVTSLQCVLILFDFVVAEDPVMRSATRIALGVGVGLLTAFVVVVTFARRPTTAALPASSLD